MPIRINLLAEAQELEERRRRDPIKRAIWTGALLVGLLVLYGAYLQTKIFFAKAELKHIQARSDSLNNEHKVVMENKRKLDDANVKLAKLQDLASTRFLTATVLDALQHTVIDEVQLVRLRTEHKYLAVEESKPKTNNTGRVTIGKPAMATEKIVLTLDAKDGSNGDQAVKYKGAITDCTYFQGALGKTNEVKMVNLAQDQLSDGRRIAQFTLECRYPEKSRQ